MVGKPEELFGHVRNPLQHISGMDKNGLLAKISRMPAPGLYVEPSVQGSCLIFPQGENLALLPWRSGGSLRLDVHTFHNLKQTSSGVCKMARGVCKSRGLSCAITLGHIVDSSCFLS